MRGLLPNKSGDPSSTSFLPEDYLQKKAERRANLVCLTLFFVVVFCVVGAFFVTNRQWSSVKTQQEMINIRYTQAAQDIEQLKELETQKSQMLRKAELVTALIERVPRSILLAELINRMPDNMTLLDWSLKSKRVETDPRRSMKKASKARSLSRSKDEDDSEQPDPGPMAPRFETSLTIVGVAASHTQVAWYVTALQSCDLLSHVELRFSESTIINDRGLNKFMIEAMIRPEADARKMDPLDEAPTHAFGESARPPQPSAPTMTSAEEEEN